MYQPGVATIRVPRHQPFELDILVENFDFSGKSPSFEVRENPESPIALVKLGRANVQGGRGVFMAAENVAGVMRTRIRVSIPKAEVEALPQAKPLGSDLRTNYGLKLDGFELFGGPLIWEAQANHG